jgi:hypothetical protein
MGLVAYWSTVDMFQGSMEAQWLEIRKDGAGWWMWGNVYDFASTRFYWRAPRRGLLELDITGYREGTWDNRGFRVRRERSTSRRRRVGYVVVKDYNAVNELTWVLKLAKRGVFGHSLASDRYGLKGSKAPKSRNPWASGAGSRVRHV